MTYHFLVLEEDHAQAFLCFHVCIERQLSHLEEFAQGQSREGAELGFGPLTFSPSSVCGHCPQVMAPHGPCEQRLNFNSKEWAC